MQLQLHYSYIAAIVQKLELHYMITVTLLRSRPGKPNQRKGQSEKFTNSAHFCEFWCFSWGKQARFTLNFCSGMPLWKVHELTLLWFGLPGPLLNYSIFSEFSGMKKQHKHKLFGPDFTGTFLTLTPGCPGVKKFLPTTGAAGKRTFWCGRPRFSARTSMTRRVVEKLCTKKVCVDFSAPKFTTWSKKNGG